MSQSAKNNGVAADRQQKCSSPLRFRSGGKEKEKMKSQKEILQLPRLQVEWTSHDGGAGMIYLNGIRQKPASIVWSFGGGWDHVSIAFPNRCPNWEEMCKVKELFFFDDETVIQFHPKKSEYVNRHPYCLHLWRKQGEEAELPPQIFV